MSNGHSAILTHGTTFVPVGRGRTETRCGNIRHGVPSDAGTSVRLSVFVTDRTANRMGIVDDDHPLDEPTVVEFEYIDALETHCGPIF